MAKNVLNESQSEDFAPISTTSDAAEAKIGWYDATLDASFWLSRKYLTALEAATLLCQQNPHDDSSHPLLISTDETSPHDFKRLLRVFEDDVNHDNQSRTLTHWLSIAKGEGLKYHSWIDDYLAAIDTVNPSSSEPTTVGNSSRITVNDEPIRKRIALVGELDNIWPSIKRDLSDAVRNGLNSARVAGRHGYWNVTRAVTWAAERGKIEKKRAIQSIKTNPDSVFSETLKQLFDL